MPHNPDHSVGKLVVPQEVPKPDAPETKVERAGSPEARQEQLKSLHADMEETEAQMSACAAELETLRGMVSKNPDGVSQETRVQFEAMKTAMQNLQNDYMDTQIQIDKLEDDEVGRASQPVAANIEVATVVQVPEAVIQPAKNEQLSAVAQAGEKPLESPKQQELKQLEAELKTLTNQISAVEERQDRAQQLAKQAEGVVIEEITPSIKRNSEKLEQSQQEIAEREATVKKLEAEIQARISEEAIRKQAIADLQKFNEELSQRLQDPTIKDRPIDEKDIQTASRRILDGEDVSDLHDKIRSEKYAINQANNQIESRQGVIQRLQEEHTATWAERNAQLKVVDTADLELKKLEEQRAALQARIKTASQSM